MKREMVELEGADNVTVWIAKRKDGFSVTLTGNDDCLLFQLFQIKGSVTVVDERAATTPSPSPQSPVSAHSRAADIQAQRHETSN